MNDIPISVVIAVNNEEDNIAPLCSRLSTALAGITTRWEILFVDDASTDGTVAAVQEIARGTPQVIPLASPARIGQVQALALGLRHAIGEILITMDGDLQHRPEEIPLFVDAINAGYDLVNGRKVRRQDNTFTRTAPALLAKWIVRLAFSSRIRDPNSTFRAYRRHLLPALLESGECLRFAPLLSQLNARILEIPVECPKRLHGRSHFHLLRRLARVVCDIRLLCLIKRTPRC